MSAFDSPNHPIWSLIRLFILMVTLFGVLWVYSSKFDETEIRSITWIFLGASVVEGGTQYLSRLRVQLPKSD